MERLESDLSPKASLRLAFIVIPITRIILKAVV